MNGIFNSKVVRNEIIKILSQSVIKKSLREFILETINRAKNFYYTHVYFIETIKKKVYITIINQHKLSTINVNL